MNIHFALQDQIPRYPYEGIRSRIALAVVSRLTGTSTHEASRPKRTKSPIIEVDAQPYRRMHSRQFIVFRKPKCPKQLVPYLLGCIWHLKGGLPLASGLRALLHRAKERPEWACMGLLSQIRKPASHLLIEMAERLQPDCYSTRKLIFGM